MSRFPHSGVESGEAAGEIDLGAVARALRRRRRVVLLPTLLAAALVAAYVNVVTPRYTAQSQILLENQETFFTRPDRASAPNEAAQLDEVAVASQVQLIASPDLARRAVSQLKLAGNDEFDPSAHPGLASRLLRLLHLTAEPSHDAAEARVVDRFGEKLTVYSPPKTRVVTVEFTSRDAALAARAANTVAELYIGEQSAAKRAQARAAAEALSEQIADLRARLAKADGERERYRSSSGLLAGTNNMTITGQQVAELNGDLSKARAIQADAQAKASMIRALLRAGKAADVTEVTNNEIVRRIWDQRATVQAQLALESRTLLPGHPHIKELRAQVEGFDESLKSAAKQAATTLENEAQISGQRVANLESVLGQQKAAAGVANGDEVHLRALERIAQGYKEQLEASTTKYEEALARQGSAATPADARIIARAVTPQLPSFPKKLPFVLFATVATLVFSVGCVVAAELLSGRATVQPEPLPSGRVAARVADPAPNDPALGGPAVKRAPDGRVLAGGMVPARPAAGRAAPVLAWGVLPPVLAAARALAAYLGRFGRSAIQSERPVDAFPAVRPEMPPPGSAEVDLADTTPGALDALAARIVDAHVPGRGLHIVGTGVGEGRVASDRLIALSRFLSGRGRALIVDLGTAPTRLASLAGPEGGPGDVAALPGLSELLSGDASFAEVIHRDRSSRLHFIPTGSLTADFRDFDLILDALSETYDFIVLFTPPVPQSEIAKVMAPFADVVVLAATGSGGGEALRRLEAEMIEAGARDVLIVDPETEAVREVA